MMVVAEKETMIKFFAEALVIRNDKTLHYLLTALSQSASHAYTQDTRSHSPNSVFEPRGERAVTA